MDLLQVVKTAAIQAVESSNPVHIFSGTVASMNPISVMIEQRFTLTSEFLIVPESLLEYKVEIEGNMTLYQPPTPPQTITNVLAKGSSVTIKRGLQVGDSVILLRVQGGQKYLIIDKVVNV